MANVGVRVWVPVSGLAVLTALLILGNLVAIVPTLVALDHTSPSLPYLSDAHFNRFLSPPFTAVSVASSMLTAPIAVASYVVSRQRFCADQTHRFLCVPVRLSDSGHRTLSAIALLSACLSVCLTVVSVAIHATHRVHIVLISVAALFSIVWIFTLDISLPWRNQSLQHSSLTDQLCAFCMSLVCVCVVVSAVLAVAFSPFYRNPSAIAEYAFFALFGLFILLLAVRLRSEPLYIAYMLDSDASTENRN